MGVCMLCMLPVQSDRLQKQWRLHFGASSVQVDVQLAGDTAIPFPSVDVLLGLVELDVL